MSIPMVDLASLDNELCLGDLLKRMVALFGGYRLCDHRQQGEFHHDLIFEISRGQNAPPRFLLVATNCNGGVKELILFEQLFNLEALWHWRCPANPEFSGLLPDIVQRRTTVHYFDPCEVLRPDARSEIRPEFRTRQRGGGWQLDSPSKNREAANRTVNACGGDMQASASLHQRSSDGGSNGCG
jgi:hypothetical protein